MISRSAISILILISLWLEHPGFEKKMKIRNIHIPQRARFIFKQHRRKSKWAESMSHRFSSKNLSWILSPMSWIDSAHFHLSWIDSAHFHLSWIDSAHGTQMWLNFCLALWSVTPQVSFHLYSNNNNNNDSIQFDSIRFDSIRFDDGSYRQWF